VVPCGLPFLLYRVGMPVEDLPLTVFASIHLGGSQDVTPRLPIHGGRGVLPAGRVSDIADNVIRQELEGVRGAVRELPLEAFKQVAQFVLSEGAAPCPRTLTGSFRDQSARRGAASPL
jgi:hypothetical protein